MKPKIACSPNGPYRLINDPTAVTVDTLQSPAGGKYKAMVGFSLCRCGGSKNKPFCDGTHSTNGFRDQKLADPAKNKREAYAGKSITIFDNRAICAHAGHCTDGLKEVFKEEGTPWIDPDGAATSVPDNTMLFGVRFRLTPNTDLFEIPNKSQRFEM